MGLAIEHITCHMPIYKFTFLYLRNWNYTKKAQTWVDVWFIEVLALALALALCIICELAFCIKSFGFDDGAEFGSSTGAAIPVAFSSMAELIGGTPEKGTRGAGCPKTWKLGPAIPWKLVGAKMGAGRGAGKCAPWRGGTWIMGHPGDPPFMSIIPIPKPIPMGEKRTIWAACSWAIPAGNIIGGIYIPAPIDIICKRMEYDKDVHNCVTHMCVSTRVINIHTSN